MIKEKYEIRKKELSDADTTDDLEKSLDVSNAFISLRNQYENYLASFVRDETEEAPKVEELEPDNGTES